MNIRLSSSGHINNSSIKITGSKSETNRLLLLQALFEGISIDNISDSDDSIAMQKALSDTTGVIDIHHAGTAMRFLTAYFAQKEGSEVVLTGSQRMQERPISILVDTLHNLGAQIDYIGNEGYPPLKIKGKALTANKVTLKADVSSQYITALLLIAGALPNGLELTLEGAITSVPYIKMTLQLLAKAGIESQFEGNGIRVNPAAANRQPVTITVESDWSSASYFYAIVAMGQEGTAIALSSYSPESLQGDSALAEIYEEIGVTTRYVDDTIIVTKVTNHQPSTINRELNNTPDIAQTIAVTCFGLGIGCHLTGLHTLKIKETDRLEALKTELSKLGAVVRVTNDSLTLEPSSVINHNVAIDTYNDHRMAMAFAPLALKVPLIINEAGVVSKSYPAFWEDMQTLGFTVNEK